MTKRTRRIILAATTLFFILAVPLLLLYAWGYSFDWQKKRLVLTGGLSLKSSPKAKVILNDKPRGETPVFIKRLLPKEYQIVITKEGYYSWQKKLRIESKLVTEARNILLVPTNPKLEIVDQELTAGFSLEEFLNPEEPDNIFYIQKPSYILYKTDQANSFQEQISLTPLPSNQQYEILVSPNEQIALLNDDHQLYLLNQETRTFELISQNIQGAQFSNDNQKLLYFSPSEIWVCYLGESNNKELITRLSQEIEKALWYGQADQHIIFVVNQQIKIIELDGRDQRNTMDIIKMTVDQIGYNPADKKIYFVKGNELLRISLE